MWDRLARDCIMCTLLFVFSGVAWAQTDAPGVGRPPIGLPEALARTLERNPYLTALGFDIAAAQGRLQQAEFRPNMEIDAVFADAFGTDEFRGVRSAESTVSIAWILERGVRERIVDEARAGVAMSEAEIAIARLDALAETARRFLDSMAYQARLRNAQQGVSLAETAVEAVERRVASGRARESELLRAEAELARAELLEEDYEHELLSAYHRLSAQWGDTEPDFGIADGVLEILPELEPFESLVERIERNPNIGLLVTEQRLDEASLRLAEARSRPSWRVSTGLRRIEATDDVAFVGAITVPLRRGNRNQGRIAETRAHMARTRNETVAERVNIETELFVLYQRLNHDIQLPTRLIADVIPRIEAVLADTQRAYELGLSSYLELRDVQNELLSVNNELLEAYIDAHRLVIEIERLTGEELVSPQTAQ